MTEVLNTKPFPWGECNFKKISHGESAASTQDFIRPLSLYISQMKLISLPVRKHAVEKRKLTKNKTKMHLQSILF